MVFPFIRNIQRRSRILLISVWQESMDSNVCLNDGYSRYKGELHIVLKNMPNDGRKNVIGRLPEYEKVLLDYAAPWKPFAFVQCR